VIVLPILGLNGGVDDLCRGVACNAAEDRSCDSAGDGTNGAGDRAADCASDGSGADGTDSGGDGVITQDAGLAVLEVFVSRLVVVGVHHVMLLDVVTAAAGAALVGDGD
jgi:hypothetical protein